MYDDVEVAIRVCPRLVIRQVCYQHSCRVESVLDKKFPAPVLFLFMSFYMVSQPGFGVFRPTRTAVSAVFQAEGPGKCLKEVPELPKCRVH